MQVAMPDAPFDFTVFSSDYVSARAAFLHATDKCGAILSTYSHPFTGPDGEALATDTVWLGPRDAERVLVLLSATHGVEGFCGSAAQVDWLRLYSDKKDTLPEGIALLIIHALNPHGFAWLRRVTEQGVDLNRNFVDFSQPTPENDGYVELAASIIPGNLRHETLKMADAKLREYAEFHGQVAFEAALSGGQFTHADGLFYGGVEPTWSRLTTEAIVKDFRLHERRRVAVLDFHTGLGPFGYGEPICDHFPGTLGLALSRKWYGQSVTEPAIGTSSSVAKTGLSDYGWQKMLGDVVVFIALEFGTYPFDNMIRVLRGDHWLHAQGSVDWHAEQTQSIKAEIRRHFYPATRDWQQMILFRTRQCISQALDGLALEIGS